MITIPTLLLDKSKCRTNIQKMVAKAKRNKIKLRPHFKTPQSHIIGQWFRTAGVDRITVSSVKMADYFAKDNWRDITIAFPVNILEIKKINSLARKITLNILVESLDVIKLLKNALKSPVNVFIKIDAGYGRTGVAFDNVALIEKMIDSIGQSNLMTFSGFLNHAGHSYDCRTKKCIARVHQENNSKIATLSKTFSKIRKQIVISTGDTPTCSVMEDFRLFDEIRPGNFAFYDLGQQQIGSCDYQDIAVALACPVVAKHENRNEIIIYGGGVHFSKERLTLKNGTIIFGRVVENVGNGWGKVIKNVYVKKLSQEHGTIHAPKKFINQIKIGQVLKILPVHSCMTANLLKKYLTTEGEWIGMMG